MELVIAGATDCGTVRKVNEDFFYYSLQKRFVVVCDGMGGHQSGAVASRIAGETMRDIFAYPDLAELRFFCSDVQERLPEIALRLLASTRLANRRLYLMAEQDPAMHGMGTTLVAMAFNDTTACAVHVGDSRAYAFGANSLQQLTEDHSWVNELLQDREIRAEEAQHFSKKNVLTRALGTHPATKIDLQWFPLRSGEKFLLCSDGLHNALLPEAVAQSFRSLDESTLVREVERLVQRAKKANGSDNITAALAFIKATKPTAVRSKHVKITVPEEPEALVLAEDRFIKRQFFGMAEKKAPAKTPRRFFNPMVALAAAGIFAGWLYFFKPFNAKEEDPAAAAAFAPADSAASWAAAPQRDSHPPGVQPSALAASASDPGTAEMETHAGLGAIAGEDDSMSVAAAESDSYSSPLAGNGAQDSAAFSQAAGMPPRLVPAEAESVSFLNTASARATADTLPERADPSPESLVPQSGGRIFLPGLTAELYQTAAIFANDMLIGSVRPLAESGFILPPGIYTIAVKDTAGRVLLYKTEVKVSRGDVKTLEF